MCALHVVLARQRSIQSVSMRVPGLLSRMSSGAVNTFPVTNSTWTLSEGEAQYDDEEVVFRN